MIRVILKGGLGNQMFQYAHGKALALKHNVPLYLDLSFLKTKIPFKKRGPLKNFTYRNYDLDLFGVKDESGTIFNNNFLDKYFSYAVTLGKGLIFRKNYVWEGKNPYMYDSAISEKGPNLTLDGFWNSPKYFEQYKKEILEIFHTDKLFDPKYKAFEKEISDHKSSVSIHLRRGDYLNSKHKNIYVTLNDYYIRAIKILKDKVESPFFYIFSEEDSSWIKDFLKLNLDEYAIVNKKLSGYKNRSHFRFMSLCTHNIIANSTYSWWPAYLNKNEDKVVVAPNRWHKKYDFKNIKSWESIYP